MLKYIKVLCILVLFWSNETIPKEIRSMELHIFLFM